MNNSTINNSCTNPPLSGAIAARASKHNASNTSRSTVSSAASVADASPAVRYSSPSQNHPAVPSWDQSIMEFKNTQQPIYYIFRCGNCLVWKQTSGSWMCWRRRGPEQHGRQCGQPHAQVQPAGEGSKDEMVAATLRETHPMSNKMVYEYPGDFYDPP